MTDTATATPATETRPPAIGEAGFVPQPHAEDAELAAIEAAAAAAEQPEQPAATAAPAAEPAAEAEQAPAAEAEAGEQPRDDKGRWIPKERFDEAVLKERERAEKAIAAAAYYKGQADARATGGKPAEAAPTPEQEIAAIENAIIQKATDLDEGRLGMAEFKRFEMQAQRRLDALRAPAPAAPAEAAVGDMRLAELTAELPQRFPVLAQLQAEHVQRLQPLAEAELQYEGVPLDGSPRSAFAIRERIAQLAQARFGGAAQPAGGKPAPTNNPRQPNTKAVQDKLALAARMPPTLTKTGTAQVPQDRYSAEAIEKMDLDEIATAVPDTILRQLSGQ